MNKTLEKFCADRGLVLMPISFRFGHVQTRRKGFDIISKVHGCVLISFEPINYNSYPDKWLIRFAHVDYKGPIHIPRITRAFLDEHIPRNDHKAYFINSDYQRRQQLEQAKSPTPTQPVLFPPV